MINKEKVNNCIVLSDYYDTVTRVIIFLQKLKISRFKNSTQKNTKNAQEKKRYFIVKQTNHFFMLYSFKQCKKSMLEIFTRLELINKKYFELWYNVFFQQAFILFEIL